MRPFERRSVSSEGQISACRCFAYSVKYAPADSWVLGANHVREKKQERFKVMGIRCLQREIYALIPNTSEFSAAIHA